MHKYHIEERNHCYEENQCIRKNFSVLKYLPEEYVRYEDLPEPVKAGIQTG